MRLIQVEKLDSGSYTVKSYMEDGTMIVIEYQTSEELLKVAPMLSKEITGTQKDADFIQVWMNEDQTVSRIDAHTFPKTVNETPEIVSVDLSKIDSVSLVDPIKTDISDKYDVLNPKDPVVVDPVDPIDPIITP